jgi:hypothetical protein
LIVAGNDGHDPYSRPAVNYVALRGAQSGIGESHCEVRDVLEMLVLNALTVKACCGPSVRLISRLVASRGTL